MLFALPLPHAFCITILYRRMNVLSKLALARANSKTLGLRLGSSSPYCACSAALGGARGQRQTSDGDDAVSGLGYFQASGTGAFPPRTVRELNRGMLDQCRGCR